LLVVYGDSRGCFTCAVLKTLLKSSKIDYRFYELDEDYTLGELSELYPSFSAVPFILRDGVEVPLRELEEMLL
jgi:hypothetical protein